MNSKTIIFMSVFILFGVCSIAFGDLTTADSGVFEVTTRDLVKDSSIYDGRKVILRGEVIGDTMPRGSFAWINMKDQFNQIGVWVPLELAKRISYRGNYRYKGDIVEVEGIFKHSDEEFGGELCVRGTSLVVLEKGFSLPHELSQVKINMTWSMLGITFCLLLLRILVPMERKRK